MKLKNHFQEAETEAGCDEAGRGCLAGPVFAAAVILPAGFYHPWLNDSKQMSEERRYALRPVIEQEAIAFAVAHTSPLIIDRINILRASILAMHKALSLLETQPSLILIDGNRFRKYRQIPHHCIIKGDSIYSAIAAASVLAKTYRDDYMIRLHEKYPHYGWDQNKGYPTFSHREAIAAHGTTVHHRQSFRMQKPQARQTVLFMPDPQA
ncbi:MAG: ribonuclease HII [Chitinophagales bacterium]|nr:ribonuclease HII [Chitinophagales bacterium]